MPIVAFPAYVAHAHAVDVSVIVGVPAYCVDVCVAVLVMLCVLVAVQLAVCVAVGLNVRVCELVTE